MERRVARDKVGARPSSQDDTTRLCYSLVSWGPPELGLGLCLMALGFYTYELLKEGVARAHMPFLHAWEPHSMGHDTRSFPFVLSPDLHSLKGKANFASSDYELRAIMSVPREAGKAVVSTVVDSCPPTFIPSQTLGQINEHRHPLAFNMDEGMDMCPQLAQSH